MNFFAQVEPDVIRMAGSRLDYTDQTLLHPVGFLAVVVLGMALILVPRRWAIVPMVIMASLVSPAQRMAIMTIDFNLLRIMILFGVARLYLKKETTCFTWTSLDTMVVLWTISSMLVYTLQQGTSKAFVNRLGFGFDAFGMYFLFRCLIRNWTDISTLISGVILISIPVACFFIIENRTGRNLFSVFGGVPAITNIREGRLRCQGPYPHPIMAGCFWASMMPLFAANWWESIRGKYLAMMGLTASFIIVICCASSTPVMGVLSGIIGGLMFWLRRQMRPVRWGILAMLVALHIVMNNPVWHLICRVSAVGGSTSWHRYKLIDQAINRFGEWFLLGTRSTAHWGWGLQDVTNQYILEGVRGGFLTLTLFLAIIVLAFREIGKLWRSQVNDPYCLVLCWAMGVSLFVHCTNFIGVSYFGQIWILWYMLLAMIASFSVDASSLSKLRSRPFSSKLDTCCPKNFRFYGGHNRKY